MQSTIHTPSQLNQFEAHFRGVTDAVESESIPEVACCRTLVQRSYSTHSVVIPKNPVLIADADAQGAWVTAMVFVPNMALQQTAFEQHESPAQLVAWLGQKYDLDKLKAQV